MAIAFQIKFPVPDRSDQTLSYVKSEDGQLDLGWNEGLMSDGRPFRMEMWATDGISMLTVFFSSSGIPVACFVTALHRSVSIVVVSGEVRN